MSKTDMAAMFHSLSAWLWMGKMNNDNDLNGLTHCH